MSLLTRSDDFTPWTPLAAIADAQSMAQPQVPALTAFWRRVTADMAEVSEEAGARVEKLTRTASSLTDEISDVLAKPLSIAMLQELHILATRDQTAARVVLQDGTFRYVPFPYGKLKDKPNHLSIGSRVVREFCPPDRVVAELEALLREHDRLPESMIDLRAAWLVHGFLQVHPFVDGNGRVSRLLANWNFLRAGLPPLWSETTERGSGWADALDAGAKTFDLTPVTRLLAGHQERLVSRLLLLAEAPAPDSTLEQVLAHRDALAALRLRWRPHAEALRDDLPALATRAQAALEALAPRLGDGLEVTVELGGKDKPWRQAARAGIAADRHEAGATVALSSRAPRARLQITLTALGTSGSGAWSAVARVRPRSPVVAALPALTLLPEETKAAREARFDSWLDRVLADAVGSWIRIA